jgi:hypothetical protein
MSWHALQVGAHALPRAAPSARAQAFKTSVVGTNRTARKAPNAPNARLKNPTIGSRERFSGFLNNLRPGRRQWHFTSNRAKVGSALGGHQRMIITLFTTLIIFPLLVAVCGALLALRLHWTKWLVHFVVIDAILVAPLFAVYIEGILDPTTVDYPGPGEGLLLFLYLFTAVPSLLGYLVFVIWNAVLTTHGKQSVGTSC